MTTSEWLKINTKKLDSAGIGTARLDALVLLSDELQIDKSSIFAYPERILQRSELNNLNNKVIHRLHHIPLAYIRGTAEFYGRNFLVNTSVLIPRPESESIIELLKQSSLDTDTATILDVGTGSGCLAITAKCELPLFKVIAIDVDRDCLEIANKNAQKLNVEITFIQSNLLEKLPPDDLKNSVILANLPYVPINYSVNEAATHEPKIALFSGEDGLDHFRALFEQINARVHTPRIVITESLLSQHDELCTIAQNAGFVLRATDGLCQLFVIHT